ncbi:MAG: ring-opening amidohydrolase [Pseudomonadota bacterium]
MALETRVTRLPMAAPDDTSALEALFDRGDLEASSIIAILGKTEGNGCVNDYTRGYAVQSLRLLLARHLQPQGIDKICMIMSGGTEGALNPHWIVVSVDETETRPRGKALAAARAMTRPMLASEIGRLTQVELVAEAVGHAMDEALIADKADVHFVQIKCPLLTSERVDTAGGPQQVATADTLRSMGLSRGASALGVALALGECEMSGLSDQVIGADVSQYSSRASCSAGVELMACEVLVLGMSDQWSGPHAIDHTVLADVVDLDAVHALLTRCLGPFSGQLSSIQRGRVVALLAKAEAAKSGIVRAKRHTMLDDSDISSTRHARAFVGGMLAGVSGMTDLFISGGGEHQGPDGGGPCALIYSKGDNE